MKKLKLDVSLQSTQDLSSIPGLASTAESMGLDGIWSTEVNHDPFLQLALAASRTTTIEMGTAIALSFVRSPMALAYTAWDLAALSQGRFILGLGTQVKVHNEKRFSVPWDAPLPRLREVVESLRSIWQAWRTGERLNFRGQYYQFTLMTPFFTPPAHEYAIPVYIAGVNEGLCRLAGELCDGFHVHPLNSPLYLEQVVLPAILAGARTSGRAVEQVALSGSAFVISDQTSEEASAMREFARQQISFYASTPSYRIIFQVHGWEDVAGQLSSLAARKRWEEMPTLITDEMLETFAVIADPDQIGNALLDRYRGLLDRVTPYLPFVPGEHTPIWNSALRAFA